MSLAPQHLVLLESTSLQMQEIAALPAQIFRILHTQLDIFALALTTPKSKPPVDTLQTVLKPVRGLEPMVIVAAAHAHPTPVWSAPFALAMRDTLRTVPFLASHVPALLRLSLPVFALAAAAII